MFEQSYSDEFILRVRNQAQQEVGQMRENITKLRQMKLNIVKLHRTSLNCLELFEIFKADTCMSFPEQITK
jgi:hypothetical protein